MIHSDAVRGEDAFCRECYSEVQASPLLRRYIPLTHKALERGSGQISADAKVLEIGANIGEHVPFVHHQYSLYVASDYRETAFCASDPRVVFALADVHELPFQDSSFDRVISTCVLHHVGNPIAALLEMRRVVRPGGSLSIHVPCDPGLMYRVGKSVGPYRFLRHNSAIDARVEHYVQHRNHFPQIDTLLRYVFRADKLKAKWWPFRFASWNLNLFVTYQVTLTH